MLNRTFKFKMDDNCLQSVENRLTELENRIFGQLEKDNVYPRDSESALDTLAQINAKINAAVAGKTSIEGVMNRLSELEAYMDPTNAKNLTLSPEAKIDIILAEENLIRTQAANLEKIESMTNLLKSEHIKAVPSLQGRLHELSQININTQDATGELIGDAKKLLVNYNTAIQSMSKCFVMWDEVLTEMEVQSQIQPRDVDT